MVSMSRLFNQLVEPKTICVLDSFTNLENNGCDEQAYTKLYIKFLCIGYKFQLLMSKKGLSYINKESLILALGAGRPIKVCQT